MRLRMLSAQRCLIRVCFLACMCTFGYAAAGQAAVVGLLSTQASTYPREHDTAIGIMNLLVSLGAEKVVLIDYNEIVADNDNDPAAVENRLREFLESNHVDRVFIPGNHYNIVSPPLPPVPHRQLATTALIRLMGGGGLKLRLLAICGGLQGVLYAQGVDIDRVENMLGSSAMARSHEISLPNPRLAGVPLMRMRALPGTRLASILEKINDSGDMVFYMPDAHSEAVSNTAENIEKLKDLGYKLSAFSDDGIIEALEDKRGNMLLQMHPEYLLMNVEQKVGKHSAVDRSVEVARAIIGDFLGEGPDAVQEGNNQ
ncbi:MAG: gamma-glutamyl-gamma-aminobutyrate hydrolase family protein [Anaplasma sp.]